MDLSFYTNFSNELAQQEASLNTLEQEVASGVAVSSAAQNPGAFETATLGDDQVSALSADASTQAAISSQLGSVSSTYQSVSTLFDTVQQVLEQALNGTTSTANMSAFATQITSASQQLVGLANTTGANGTYLFAGSRGAVEPFQTDAAGNVIYLGDGGSSQAAISPDTTASTIANGESFMTGLSGNGFGSATAASANTGSALLVSDGVTNVATASAFQSGSSPITLSFATGTSGLTYTATQGGNTISTGAVTSGMSLNLAGMDYQLNGTPAAGDSFTVSPARPVSAFALLQNIATTMAGASGTTSAQTDQQLSEELATLGQYQQSVLTSQAQTGVTLQAVSSAGVNDATQSDAVQTQVTNAIGVDMPTALTALNETLTSVQAAEKAFASVQSLSLFNFI